MWRRIQMDARRICGRETAAAARGDHDGLGGAADVDRGGSRRADHIDFGNFAASVAVERRWEQRRLGCRRGVATAAATPSVAFAFFRTQRSATFVQTELEAPYVTSRVCCILILSCANNRWPFQLVVTIERTCCLVIARRCVAREALWDSIHCNRGNDSR